MVSERGFVAENPWQFSAYTSSVPQRAHGVMLGQDGERGRDELPKLCLQLDGDESPPSTFATDTGPRPAQYRATPLSQSRHLAKRFHATRAIHGASNDARIWVSSIDLETGDRFQDGPSSASVDVALPIAGTDSEHG